MLRLRQTLGLAAAVGVTGVLTGLPTARGGDQPMPIDRQALVRRHTVRRQACNPHSPLQVGNGEFAFGVDITGLQTFVPFNTMSQWGWHSSGLPRGARLEQFQGQIWETHGRAVRYPMPDPQRKALSEWLAANPHRLNLGRIGLQLTNADGTATALEDLTNTRQELDLWLGVVTSRFELAGVPVRVRTCCHPELDAVAVEITSPLLEAGRLAVNIFFPYADLRYHAAEVGDWKHPKAHQTQMHQLGDRRVDFARRLDATVYSVALRWAPAGEVLPFFRQGRRQELKIVKAEYGARQTWLDVTSAVQDAVQDNRLWIRADNHLAGDPLYKVGKQLKVSYTLGGKGHTARVNENQYLTIQAETTEHRFTLVPQANGEFSFVCAFSPEPIQGPLPEAPAVFDAAARYWPRFWRRGGAIDLSASRDPRWRELERRIVLSQYLMAVNEAGSQPPQESGLVNNGWHGRFHFEMLWWHAAHYFLWGRQHLAAPSLGVYSRLLESARERARQQGYEGARWPKCTGPDGREWPHLIHALLIWQQPHPIFFAELDYRAAPTPASLEKWRNVVFATADFMASYAWRNPDTGRYDLGPPLVPVSENTDAKLTRNPTFELAYWRTGLLMAQRWRERLGLARNSRWDQVLDGLAPLPEEDGCYVLYEGIDSMWQRWNWEHPALTGIYGMLPGDGVDPAAMERTFQRVMETWRFDRVWGWDLPMLAMCAARLGHPEQAVDLLLHPTERFQFDDAGLCTGGPFPYFPANGGLLYAVAMMAAGWDPPTLEGYGVTRPPTLGGSRLRQGSAGQAGATRPPTKVNPAGTGQRHAPGFPDNGQWTVHLEGLRPAP